MKKVLSILILTVLLVASFSSCAQKKELSIKVCGYSDSIPENPHKLEFTDWNGGYFVDTKAKDKVTITVNGSKILGSYVKSNKRFFEFYNTHQYEDENNCIFSITDDGKLSTYFFRSSSLYEKYENTNEIYSEAECANIASLFLSEIVDVSQYTVTTTYDENMNMYIIRFKKYVDGFECADQAEIWVESNGHIYSYSSFALGQVPSNAKSEFDMEIIQPMVVSKLDSEYAKAKSVYDSVSYKDFIYKLTVNDKGQYALICTVDVDCINYYTEYEEVRGEKIQFIIQ